MFDAQRQQISAQCWRISAFRLGALQIQVGAESGALRK